MTSFMISVLLLAGASDSSGLSLQAQLGYEPALLYMGKDFAAPADPIDIASFFYLSHALSGKAGVETKGGWQILITGSLDNSFFSGDPNIKYYVGTDSGDLWLPTDSRWVFWGGSIGGEAGHSLEFRSNSGGVYLGLEVVIGNLSGNTVFYKGATPRTEHISSKMLGLQGHLGMSIPIASFGNFSLHISPMLKGGAVKEQSSIIPDDAVWLGPYTLYKWGLALGLILNYDGGENK